MGLQGESWNKYYPHWVPHPEARPSTFMFNFISRFTWQIYFSCLLKIKRLICLHKPFRFVLFIYMLSSFIVFYKFPLCYQILVNHLENSFKRKTKRKMLVKFTAVSNVLLRSVSAVLRLSLFQKNSSTEVKERQTDRRTGVEVLSLARPPPPSSEPLSLQVLSSLRSTSRVTRLSGKLCYNEKESVVILKQQTAWSII